MLCDESIIDTKGACCSDCGNLVDADSYEPLRELKAEREAAQQTGIAHRKQDKERQRQEQKDAEYRRKKEEVLRRQQEQFEREQAGKTKLQERKEWQR
jgi:hypothetical protein